MEIIDGKNLSNIIRSELKGEIENNNYKVSLAVLSIGENKSSEIYIRNKKKACEEVGISFLSFHFDDDALEEEVLSKINELNNNQNINGILLQLPVPDKFDSVKLLNTINPNKDVDGLTNVNAGINFTNKSVFVPCTAKGIIKMFDYYNIDLTSKNVTIVGRSNLVGKPVMIECLKRNASVSICHSKTTNLIDYTKNADILIVATGAKYLISEDMVKEGSIIIDVGISSENGKIYGDVNPNVDSKCNMKSPVPGGVGPMTVAMLLSNTLLAYKVQNGINNE